MSAGDTKLCPMCGATIKAVAVKCRFCGEMLSPVEEVDSSAEFASRRLEPRGFLPLFLSVAPVSGGFFGLFWSLGFGALQNRPFDEILPFGIGAGIFFGLFFGGFMAHTMCRDTRTLPATDRNEFIQRLNAAASEMRYVPAARSAGILLYKPRSGAGVGSGIRVELQPGEAVLVGPKANLSKLAKLLEKSATEYSATRGSP